jgi:hypothetical protein
VSPVAGEDVTDPVDETVASSVTQDVEHPGVDDDPKREIRRSELRHVECIPREDVGGGPPPVRLVSRLLNRRRRQTGSEHVVAVTGQGRR